MLRIYNTLTNRVEPISTVERGVVRIYTCGPTVYRYAHVGNLRSYLMADWIRRAIGEGGRQERELAEKYLSWAKLRSPHYPFVGGILEGIADDYERQARREDDEAQIEQRLEH